MSENQPKPLDRNQAESIFEQFRTDLERFLLGLCGDQNVADDVLQTTFAKLIEKGQAVNAESMRSWLFRVAHNDAMLVARKRGVERRALEQISRYTKTRSNPVESPDGKLEQEEQNRKVRAALNKLPEVQQQIVKLRIFENRKFAEIAEQLELPLGTVLSRMHAAIKKLNNMLSGEIE